MMLNASVGVIWASSQERKLLQSGGGRLADGIPNLTAN